MIITLISRVLPKFEVVKFAYRVGYSISNTINYTGVIYLTPRTLFNIKILNLSIFNIFGPKFVGISKVAPFLTKMNVYIGNILRLTIVNLICIFFAMFCQKLELIATSFELLLDIDAIN